MGTWPARKSGQAASSSRRRFAAISSGSSPVPDRYGPAMRINKGFDSVTPATLAPESAELKKNVKERAMLAAQRRELLLTRLRQDQRLVAKDLAAELGVSEDSVRRDLRELAA